MSETNLERVTQDAGNKSGEAWREAANRVGNEALTMQKKADEAQNEAELLSRKAQMKADEAHHFRKESATFESAEAAMAAKADVAAAPPGIGDRLRAGLESVKEKFKSTMGNASRSIEETGDRASEKYNEAVASVKESAAETMASTANKSADAAERLAEGADRNLEKAQLAKDKADASKLEREREREYRDSNENKIRYEKTDTEKLAERPLEDERDDRRDRDRDRGSLKESLKEKTAGHLENAAEYVGDKARETEESMGDRRRDAQLAQGKVPERI